MSITENILKRRTINRFKPIPVDDKYIDEALKLSVYAPNHHLTFPYHFYKLKTNIKEKMLAHAYDTFKARSAESADRKIEKWKNIPGWILITQKKQEDPKTDKEDFASISIALYIMMLVLAEHDIGSKWSTGSLFFTPEWYELCDIDPSKEEILGMFWYGYCEKVPECPPRPEFNQYVTVKD